MAGPHIVPAEEGANLKRNLGGYYLKALITVGAATSFFHLYTGGFGLISALDQRGIHLLLMLVMAFLLYAGRPKTLKSPTVVDWLFVAASFVSSMFMILTWETRTMRVAPPSVSEVVLGVVILVCVLEAARRVVGVALPVTALVFILYALLGENLPGILMHKPYDLSRLVSFLYLTPEGIYGVPLGVSSTFVVLFILFGAFLNTSGGGKYFIDFAYALTGRTRGGPAKTAVLSSALMGTISGSPIANVVTTGTFTIPLMIKAGYKRHVAGAVEAVSSTGGMIMPPVMGAAAFIIAEYLNVPYFTVAVAAIIPAVLYYVCVYFMVDFEAQKHGLKGLPAKDLPNLRESLKAGGHLFLPVILLICFMVFGWSAMKSVFWSLVFLVLIAMLRKETRFNSGKVIKALWDGAQGAIPVAISCACAGIVVGVISMTGLGVRFSSSLLDLSGGSLPLALVFTMLSSLILGMGLPAVAVYLVTSALNVPALVKMGVLPMAAHMFVFYYGIISTITPPVALTAYAGAGVAGASPSKTGWQAFFFGIVAYIVPFMFVYSPCLLMQGSALAVITSTITALFGVYFVSAGVEGYLFCKASITQRALLLAAGVLLIKPGGFTDFLGAVLAFGAIALNYAGSKRVFRKVISGSN